MIKLRALLIAVTIALTFSLSAFAADTDGDGLDDLVETNTGTYIDEFDTGTDPINPDSDFDGVMDGPEVSGGSHPLDSTITPSSWKIGTDVKITSSDFWSGDRNPSLVWTGSKYAVTWSDDSNGSDEIYFTELDSSGNLTTGEVRITNNLNWSRYPSLVWTDINYGVAWHDDRNGFPNYEIYFTRIDTSGNKIGSDMRITSDTNRSEYPSLVWTGTEYGVSWQDDRDGNTEIYFARIDPTGNKIGSDVRVTNDIGNSLDPSLVWTGTEYGVSWYDDRDGNNEIYFARIDSVGNKIGSDTRITNETSWSWSPSLVWAGTEYGVSWDESRDGNSEIYFARLDINGSKIGTDVRITNDPSGSYKSSLIWTGSEYGVSWEDYRHINYEIYFTRFDQSGIKIGPDIRISNNNPDSFKPSIVWSGTEYAISWDDYGGGEIYFVRIAVDEDGDGLSRATEEITLGTNPNDWDTDDDEMPDGWEYNNGLNPLVNDSGLDPDVDGLTNLQEYNAGSSPFNWDTDSDTIGDGTEVSNGTDPANSDTDGDGLSDGVETNTGVYNSPLDTGTDPLNPDTDGDLVMDGHEVDGGAHPLDPTITPTSVRIGPDVRITIASGNSLRPSLVWTGTKYGVSWEDNRDGNYEIYFTRIDASGNRIGADVRITNAAGESSYSSLVWTGTEYGVSWRDKRDGNFEVYFARLDGLGNKIGGDVKLTTDFGWWEHPSLVWTGTEYGISWTIGSFIHFVRVDEFGNKVGLETSITWDSFAFNPSLVWTGSEYGVSYCDEFDIVFVRFDVSGNKIGSNVQITNTIDGYFAEFPSLAWSGSEYAISWQENRDGDGSGDELYFVRLDASGNRISSDVMISPSSSDDPSLVWNGAEYGVSWDRISIDFARIDASGSKIGPSVSISDISGSHRNPSMVWSGTEYGVSWEDSRDGNYEIYFARIGIDFDGDGLFATDEIALATNPNNYDTDNDTIPDGHEFYGGTDPLVPDVLCGPTLFCYGDQDGDGIATLADYNAARDASLLKPVDYSQVYPSNGETLDVDASSVVDLPDVNIMRDWALLKSNASADPGTPATVTILSPPDFTVVPVGATVEVVIEVRGSGSVLRPGVGVVFELLTSTSEATLLGGRGNAVTKIDPDTGLNYTAGSRWSVTGDIAGGATAKIILRREAAGVIQLQARVPQIPLKQLLASISAILTLN